MTQYQVAHVDGAFRVYATESGIDRTYFEPPFRKPRAAIDYSDELAGLPDRHRSPDLAGLLGAESRDEVAVPTEAPDRTQDASVCAGCGGPLLPGGHGQRRLTCSPACRERARYHRAAKWAGPDEQAQGQNLTPSRPSQPDRTPRAAGEAVVTLPSPAAHGARAHPSPAGPPLGPPSLGL